jgi:hypothetical protein
MELRAELCPPMVAPWRIAELCAAIETIAGLLEQGASADAAIAAFNAATGHDYAAEHFLTYRATRDLEDFALEAARPRTAEVRERHPRRTDRDPLCPADTGSRPRHRQLRFRP